MYAVTTKGYRAIADGAPIEAGEVVLEVLPASLLAACAAMEARHQRDALLRGCDWTLMPDSPLSPPEQAEWTVYRQALRDLPNDPEFPNIPWPERPLGEQNGD